MDDLSAIFRRLDRLEGLFTQLSIDCKVAGKEAERALSLAQEALIEIKSQAKSTHTKEIWNETAYNKTFQPTDPEALTDWGDIPDFQPVQYGPPEKKHTEEKIPLGKNAALFDDDDEIDEQEEDDGA